MAKAPTGWRKLFDYHVFKSAVNGYLHRYAGGDARSVFYDIDEVCPELSELTRHYRSIQSEFDGVSAAALRPYHEIDPGEAEISAAGDPRRKWNVYMLYMLGHRFDENCRSCPFTSRLLETIPNLMQAFFSVLDPRKSVPLHEGPYLGYLRYHLGLRVPSVSPPKLIVAGQECTWREGEATMFDDSWPHEVINEADGSRAVLIVDVLRPLPPLADLVNRFVTGVVARHTYGRAVARRVRAGGGQPRPWAE